MKCEIFKGKDGQWYYRFKSRNGRHLCRCSEGNGYVSKGNAKRAAKNFIKEVTITIF